MSDEAKRWMISIFLLYLLLLHDTDTARTARHSMFISNVSRSVGLLAERLVTVDTFVSDLEMDVFHVSADRVLFPTLKAAGFANIQIPCELDVALVALS